MEATISSGPIYDHVLPHAPKISGGSRAVAACARSGREENDQIDANKIADCL
jgi:transposase